MSFLPARQVKSIFSLTGGPVVRSSNISIQHVTHLKYNLILDDEKWVGKLKALGMAQGTFPMENITSAKFRIFLAEKAVNYLFIVNVNANVLLTDTNIGCPNISFGTSTSPFRKVVDFRL